MHSFLGARMMAIKEVDMTTKSKPAGAFFQGALEALTAHAAAVSVERACYFGGHIVAALAVRLIELLLR